MPRPSCTNWPDYLRGCLYWIPIKKIHDIITSFELLSIFHMNLFLICVHVFRFWYEWSSPHQCLQNIEGSTGTDQVLHYPPFMTINSKKWWQFLNNILALTFCNTNKLLCKKMYFDTNFYRSKKPDGKWEDWIFQAHQVYVSTISDFGDSQERVSKS